MVEADVELPCIKPGQPTREELKIGWCPLSKGGGLSWGRRTWWVRWAGGSVGGGGEEEKFGGVASWSFG